MPDSGTVHSTSGAVGRCGAAGPRERLDDVGRPPPPERRGRGFAEKFARRAELGEDKKKNLRDVARRTEKQRRDDGAETLQTSRSAVVAL
jgi:hypothetical protein